MIPKTKYTDPRELQPECIKIDNEKRVHSTETRVVDCPGVDLARKTEKDWRRYTASLKGAKQSPSVGAECTTEAPAFSF